MDREITDKELSRFMKLAGILNEMEFEYGDEDEQARAARARKMEDDDTEAENAERGDFDESADYEGTSGDTAAMGNIDEAGNVKGIKIEIPSNSYASDFGKAAAREVVESFGPREYRNFLEAFLSEFKKITGGV